ncbi:MAG: glycosyltransferase [Longimicrobiales bacterium]|nr:glycosyltransferase [Longimicrobiales bacterium]
MNHDTLGDAARAGRPPAPASPPEVTVIMACRNGLPFLGQSLDSLVAQTFTAWELIVVDGGSTDGSVELATHYGPQVRVLLAPDAPPPGVARNRAAAEARAPLLAFLDADDCWRADKLERQVALLRASGATLVFSDCRVLDRRGQVLGRYLSRHRPARGAVSGLLLMENFVPLCTVLVTREAFASVGGFPEGFWAADDYLFVLRVARLGAFEFDEGALADYRVHAGSLTRDFRRVYQENVQLFESLLEDAADDVERARARAALGLLCWRWALREAAGGAFGRAWSLAGRAVRATGGRRAVGTFLAAVATWLRGFPVRVRMARARRGAP